jgi:hypothetical protein
MVEEEMTMSGMKLLMSDNRGVYIPQHFAEQYGSEWTNIRPEDLEIIMTGPHREEYWDAWSAVCDNAAYTDSHGNMWNLHQDGDLWAVCEKLMTDEEYYGFYGEHRSDFDSDSRLETDNWYDTSEELK